MSTLTYETVTKSVIDAVKEDDKSKGKWLSAGQAVSVFYMSAENLEAVKAQFIADAILPAMPKHAAALAVELPRKGSEEYNKMGESSRAKWEAANDAKKAARSTANTYFSRIVSYAFPKEKAESAPKSIEVKFNEALTNLIKACEKAEDAPFDVISVKACLVKAQKLVNAGVLNQLG